MIRAIYGRPFAALILVGALTLFLPLQSWAGHKKKQVDTVQTVSPTLETRYHNGVQAFESQQWRTAASAFQAVVQGALSSELGQEALFYLGVSQFYQEEYDLANRTLSRYLALAGAEQTHFQQVIGYKFAIAEKLREGERCRLFGWKGAPKWSSGSDLALKIYEEVLAAMPGSELSASALLGKGALLRTAKEYPESIEAYQLLVRRFPKSPQAIEAHLSILEVYLEESQEEFQSPDLLELARLALARFTQDFPKEERLAQGQQLVASMEEHLAKGWYETGRFYERISQPEASKIYYLKTVRDFPYTEAATLSQKRLSNIDRIKK